jgi:hypothetical protein
MNYVLIDFENVQPKNLEILSKHPFKVFIFCGANQTKLPYDLTVATQPLGDNARYVKISGNGRNALDFHIACYVGELATLDPQDISTSSACVFQRAVVGSAGDRRLPQVRRSILAPWRQRFPVSGRQARGRHGNRRTRHSPARAVRHLR